MTMPNALIIGAAKSGTTSLFKYLLEHPDAYSNPLKEPSFFAFENDPLDYKGPDESWIKARVTTLSDYQALFKDVGQQKIIFDASPHYLHSKTAAAAMQKHVPQAKLIAILRQPATRAFSDFCYVSSYGIEPQTDFAKAIADEEERIQKHWSPVYLYKYKGFYYQHLKRYFERFPREQIKIYLYEDLQEDAEGLMKDVFRFLGIDDTFLPDTKTKHLVSNLPRNKLLYSVLGGSNPLKSFAKQLIPESKREQAREAFRRLYLKKRPRLSEDLHRQLTAEYRPDIEKLQELIDRDLTHWL